MDDPMGEIEALRKLVETQEELIEGLSALERAHVERLRVEVRLDRQALSDLTQDQGQYEPDGWVSAELHRKSLMHVRRLYQWLDTALLSLTRGHEPVSLMDQRDADDAAERGRTAARIRAEADEAARQAAAWAAAQAEAAERWERDRPVREAALAAARIRREAFEAKERERLDPALFKAEDFGRMVALIRDLEARGLVAPPAPRKGAWAWWGERQRGDEFTIRIDAVDWLTDAIALRWMQHGWVIPGGHGLRHQVTRANDKVTVFQFDPLALRAAGLVLPERARLILDGGNAGSQ